MKTFKPLPKNGPAQRFDVIVADHKARAAKMTSSPLLPLQRQDAFSAPKGKDPAAHVQKQVDKGAQR